MRWQEGIVRGGGGEVGGGCGGCDDGIHPSLLQL